MKIRHVRCLIAVAEEFHFSRAAEPSAYRAAPAFANDQRVERRPEREALRSFVRSLRSTRMTRTERLFLEHMPRGFNAMQQARDSVRAAADGFHGQLRVALSDGITPSRFSAFLALCRQEKPEVEIRLAEVQLA